MVVALPLRGLEVQMKPLNPKEYQGVTYYPTLVLRKDYKGGQSVCQLCVAHSEGFSSTMCETLYDSIGGCGSQSPEHYTFWQTAEGLALWRLTR